MNKANKGDHVPPKKSGGGIHWNESGRLFFRMRNRDGWIAMPPEVQRLAEKGPDPITGGRLMWLLARRGYRSTLRQMVDQVERRDHEF